MARLMAMRRWDGTRWLGRVVFWQVGYTAVRLEGGLLGSSFAQGLGATAFSGGCVLGLFSSLRLRREAMLFAAIFATS